MPSTKVVPTGADRPHDRGSMTTTVRDERGTGDVRARLHEAALRLFAEHGVSGTSLQMIADDIGVTKAAVYYHYRTKDEIVLGVITPFMDRLAEVTEAARAQRGRRAQVETVLTGLVDVVVAAREVYVVMAHDPSVGHLQAGHERLRGVGEQLLALISGPDPDDETRITALVFLAGLTGPLSDPASARTDDDELRRVLLDLGRRLLLSRRPSRS